MTRGREGIPQSGMYVNKLTALMVLIKGGVPDQQLRKLRGVNQDDIREARERLRREASRRKGKR